MGQRSQIYISWDMKSEGDTSRREKGLIASYFGWNYGEQMISRARSIIEKLKADYVGNGLSVKDSYEKLCTFCEGNFDTRDIVKSGDILAEVRDEWDGDTAYIFDQDNNDGQLFIRVTDDGIKYCFADIGNYAPMDGEAYMDWDCPHWRDPNSEYKLDDEALKYTLNNIQWLRDNATLMTPQDAQDFIHADYEEILNGPVWYGTSTVMDIPIAEYAPYKKLLTGEHISYDAQFIISHSIVKSWPVNFGNGVTAQLNLCAGNKDTPLYMQGVLYNKGVEVTRVIRSSGLSGVWNFDDITIAPFTTPQTYAVFVRID